MDFTKIKVPIAVVAIVIAQAFGIIWYVAQLDSTVKNLDSAISGMPSVVVLEADLANLKETIEYIAEDSYLDGVWASIDALDDRIDDIEKQLAVANNEMRTIMAEHRNFNDILKELGIKGYGDTREYGNYSGD